MNTNCFILKYTKKAVLLLLIIIVCFTNGCRHSSNSNSFSDTGFYYDTVITITLYQCENEQTAQQIIDECMEMAAHYERLLSPTIEGSDIWNLNHSEGNAVTVDSETVTLINLALDYAKLSDGIVDPTIGTLSQLWNFGSANQKIVPKDSEIQEALSHVDYHSLKIEGNQIHLTDPQAQLELGFIAKGFIADKLKDYLVSQNITSAIINLGGNVVTVGSKPDGSPFNIGIQEPFSNQGTVALRVESSDSSVVSSGNYERYFEEGGKLYHHILSTETGYPADTGVTQVSILHNDSAECDALSTLCFLLGYEKSVLLLEKYPEVQAVFITEDGEIHSVNM